VVLAPRQTPTTWAAAGLLWCLTFEMGSLLDKCRPRTLDSSAPRAQTRQPTGAFYELRFVPARWLFVLGAVARELVTGRLTKFGLVGIVWSFTPRAVKLGIAGFAAAGAIVVLGALAAIALLVLQVS
jgi:hypothetical protein